MKFIKSTILISTLLIGFAVMEQKADAYTSFSFGVHHGYYGHGYWPYRYYRPYYYPYFYSPFFYQPYSFGYGYYPGPYYYSPLGEVRAEVKPSKAKVFVDGDYVGVADDYDGWWQRLELEPGKHRLVFRYPGYVPYVVTMRIIPGQDYHINYEMVPGQDLIDEGQMRLPREEYEREYPPPDRNGDRYGHQYEPRRDNHDRYEPRPPWDDERHREPPRYEPRGEEEEYGNSNPDEFSEPARDINLIVKIFPNDATVYIDGNYYGTADVGGPGELQVMLPPGAHRIEVVRPGYESQAQTVTVEEGSSKRIEIRLHRKGE